MFKKLFRESLIYGLSGYIGKFIGIFLLPLYTYALAPADYGVLDLLGTVSLVSSFLIISGTDAAFAYYYFRKEYSEQKRVIVSTSLWIRLIFSICVFIVILFFSGMISKTLFGTDHSLFVIITGLTVVFSSIFFFFQELLRFEFRPWLYTIISSSSILINILLTIYFVLVMKKGVYGAITAGCITYSIVAASTILYVFKRYGFGLSRKWIKEILKYGYPLIGTGIAVWVLTSTDKYFLAHYTNLSYVGIYAVGAKVAAIIGMISGAFQMAWGPFAMEIQYEQNAKKIYANIFFLFSALNIFAIFGISMFAIDILKVFTQPLYYSAKAVVPFLCLSTVLSSGYFMVALGMNLSKKLEHTIWITVSASIINIILNYFLVTVWGVVGAAFSIMTANFIIFILTFKTSQKFYFIPFNYKQVLILALPAAAIVFAVYYFNLILFYRIILSFLYITFTTIFVYKSFKDTDDFKKLLNKISHIKQKKTEHPDTADINL